MTMATHVGVLNEGKLVQFGTPRDIYENPNSLYVASRLGVPRINILPAHMHSSSPSQAATMGLRPEQIVIKKLGAQGDLTATIHRIESLGDQTRLHLTVDNHSWKQHRNRFARTIVF